MVTTNLEERLCIKKRNKICQDWAEVRCKHDHESTCEGDAFDIARIRNLRYFKIPVFLLLFCLSVSEMHLSINLKNYKHGLQKGY